jgi:FkbM family methyltransferase
MVCNSMMRPALSRDERISLVTNLYARLASGNLLSDDLLAADQAKYSRTGDLIRRMHADQSIFDQFFSAFHPTYDIFRMFDSSGVVLDVGAHWGYSAMAMRRQGCRAKIVSIEAMEVNTRELAVLKELEGGAYDYVHAGATDVEQDLTFYVPAVNGYANTGSSSTGDTLSDPFAFILADLATTYPAAEGEADRFQLIEQVSVGRRIDDIVETLGLADRVRAIKMDVEGHEAPALRGAKVLLETQRPLIMVEGANRDPGVAEEMQLQGYVHFERHDSRLVRHDSMSSANDGFWVHVDEIAGWRDKGLVA